MLIQILEDDAWTIRAVEDGVVEQQPNRRPSVDALNQQLFWPDVMERTSTKVAKQLTELLRRVD